MNWTDIWKNLKTSIAGIAAFLFAIPAVISALQAWAAHQPVDWRAVLVSGAETAIGAGLLAAKDSTTHSTVAQVEKSSDDTWAATANHSTVAQVEKSSDDTWAATAKANKSGT